MEDNSEPKVPDTETPEAEDKLLKDEDGGEPVWQQVLNGINHLTQMLTEAPAQPESRKPQTELAPDLVLPEPPTTETPEVPEVPQPPLQLQQTMAQARSRKIF